MLPIYAACASCVRVYYIYAHGCSTRAPNTTGRRHYSVHSSPWMSVPESRVCLSVPKVGFTWPRARARRRHGAINSSHRCHGACALSPFQPSTRGYPPAAARWSPPLPACLRDDATSMSRIESPPCTAAPCLAPTLGSWANRSCRVIPGGCFEPPSLRPACDVARWLLVVVWVALRVVSVVWHDGERWSGVVHGGPGVRAGEEGGR